MREPIKQRLTQLWDYEKFNVLIKESGRYFFHRNDGLQNQFVLYVQDALDAERMLIAPNTWSADGATALGECRVPTAATCSIRSRIAASTGARSRCLMSTEVRHCLTRSKE